MKTQAQKLWHGDMKISSKSRAYFNPSALLTALQLCSIIGMTTLTWRLHQPWLYPPAQLKAACTGLAAS
jgi:hypothetical protein